MTLKIQPGIEVTHDIYVQNPESSDEILEANSPAEAGGSKEERKRERISERPVVSLTRPTPPHNRTGLHRAVPVTNRMAHQANGNQLKTTTQTFMSKPSDKQKAGKMVQHKAADYDKVLAGVVELLDAARRASARVVNSLMTATYW